MFLPQTATYVSHNLHSTCTAISVFSKHTFLSHSMLSGPLLGALKAQSITRGVER